MNRVRVETPTVRGDTLVGEVSTSGAVGRFFSGKPFRASYGRSIENVPDHLRAIPVLAHVCPVAWATGADVVVDRVDATFLDAIRSVRTTLTDLYPEFMSGGSVYCPTPVRTDVEPGTFDGTGTLFTGGVDSTATYVRHREADPTVISVRGWEIGEDEDRKWEESKEFVTTFAEERGIEARFVESNMLTFLASPLLQAHFQRYLDGAWYSSVGHGLGLLGLCAPLAHADRMGTVHIAATHTEEWSRPWGSVPDIDDRVAWSGTNASHDGYELSRQDKLDLIADAAADPDTEPLTLRTCGYGGPAGNCNDCEKCHRTMLGLVLAGLDPNDFGYDCDADTFAGIRRHFERGEWYLSPQTGYHWTVLQDAARERSTDRYPNAGSFFEWFDRRDVDAFVRASERSYGHRLVQRLARNTPTPVYSLLYPLYRRVADTPH